MSATDRTFREESVRQHCRLLRMPTVAAQFIRLAEEAIKQQYGPVRYLEALLAAELEERERSAIARRIFEAKLPRVKTLEEFDFSQAPQVSAARIHQLAEGGYIQKAEPLVFCWGARYWQNASCHWAVCGGLPATPACTPHHGNSFGERVSRSKTHESAQPCFGALVALRADCG